MTVRSAGTRKAAELLAESATKFCYVTDYKMVIPPPKLVQKFAIAFIVN